MAWAPTGTVKDELKGEVAAFEDMHEVLHGSHLVEACSVVVSGWGRGEPPPEGLVEAIGRAAGAEPVAAVQPMACHELEAATERRDAAALAVVEQRAKSGGGGVGTQKGEKEHREP